MLSSDAMKFGASRTRTPRTRSIQPKYSTESAARLCPSARSKRPNISLSVGVVMASDLPRLVWCVRHLQAYHVFPQIGGIPLILPKFRQFPRNPERMKLLELAGRISDSLRHPQGKNRSSGESVFRIIAQSRRLK